MYGMLQQIRSFFWNYPYKNTWSVNGRMINTKFTSLKNIVAVSLYR